MTSGSCRYHRMSRSEARCALGGLRIAFIGDSLLRNLFENFALLLQGSILTLDSSKLGKKVIKWGDFLQIDESANTSMIFHWAPLVPPPDETDPVQGQIMPRPFAAALAGLFANGQGKGKDGEREGPGRAGTAGAGILCPAWLGGIDWNGFTPGNDRPLAAQGDWLEPPRVEFEEEATKQPFVYDRRPLPNGGGWLSYCSTPDVVVLNYGLWHKGNHARNLAMLEAQLETHWPTRRPGSISSNFRNHTRRTKRDDEAHGASIEVDKSGPSSKDRNSTQSQTRAGRGTMRTLSTPPPLLIVVLPWRVRRHWSKPQGSTQRDPELATAEPQYAPKTLRKIGLELTRICERFAPHCYALDAWQLSYLRAKDSEDGRHFDFDTPTLNTIMSLMINAVGMLVPPSGNTGANILTSPKGQRPGHRSADGCCGIRHVAGSAGYPCTG